MPHHARAVTMREEAARQHHRVVQVHDRRVELPEQLPQPAGMAGEEERFADEDEPAQTLLHVPRMRERRHGPRVDGRTGACQHGGGVSPGNEDVRLPALVERRDQEREAADGAARLRPVVDEEDAPGAPPVFSVAVPDRRRRPHLLVFNQYYRPGVEATAQLLTRALRGARGRLRGDRGHRTPARPRGRPGLRASERRRA